MPFFFVSGDFGDYFCVPHMLRRFLGPQQTKWSKCQLLKGDVGTWQILAMINSSSPPKHLKGLTGCQNARLRRLRVYVPRQLASDRHDKWPAQATGGDLRLWVPTNFHSLWLVCPRAQGATHLRALIEPPIAYVCA